MCEQFDVRSSGMAAEKNQRKKKTHTHTAFIHVFESELESEYVDYFRNMNEHSNKHHMKL